MATIKNVAFYCRVAHSDDFALNQQKDKLMEYALGQGYNVKATVTETASGLNINRLGLRELCTAIAAGGIDAVLVNNTSRVYRDTALLYRFIDFLKANDMQFLSLSEGIVHTEMNMRTLIGKAMKDRRVRA